MAMMFTPTIAALVIAIVERRLTSFTSEVGLWPIKRPGKFAIALVLAYVIPLGFILQAPFIGTWLGVFPGDLQNFTVLRVVSGQEGPTIYLLGQAGLIVVAGLMNSLFALGEEIGWRGWLWIRLQPYGQLVSILVSGVVWGIWHAPLVLLATTIRWLRACGESWLCAACVPYLAPSLAGCVPTVIPYGQRLWRMEPSTPAWDWFHCLW